MEKIKIVGMLRDMAQGSRSEGHAAKKMGNEQKAREQYAVALAYDSAANLVMRYGTKEIDNRKTS